MRSPEFSLAALHAALDAERRARGITWQDAMREINGRSEPAPLRSISRSTVMNLRTGSLAEADGVLQMLRWLNRAPESFVAGAASGPTVELPAVAPERILRFDTRKLHAALDARRAERRMTWRQVADEIGGILPASLARLKKGGRTSFPPVMRMIGWLGQPAAAFVRGCDR